MKNQAQTGAKVSLFLIPYSTATFASDFLSWVLARLRRDITVPIGMSRICATSL